MVEVINSSFIPKNEFKKAKVKKKGPRLNLFFLISLIIFLSTVIGVIWVVLAKQSLNKKLDKMDQVLQEKKDSYAISDIQEFSRISKKIKFSRELLNKHYNILPIFEFLEQRTLEAVKLDSFQLDENDEYIKIKSSGSTPYFEDLQQQARLYAENKNITDLILSNINKSNEGYVIFDLDFSVNKKYLTSRSFWWGASNKN